MTTIFERVEAALAAVSPPLNYALAPYKGALPDAFVTHQLIISLAEQHADNTEVERSYLVQITIWDKAGVPSTTNVDTAMLAAGFQKSNVRQLPQDPQTHHYGLAVEYVYFETKE